MDFKQYDRALNILVLTTPMPVGMTIAGAILAQTNIWFVLLFVPGTIWAVIALRVLGTKPSRG